MSKRACCQGRRIIHDLAKEVAEIADLPVHAERVQLRKDLNDLRPRRPMVIMDPQGLVRAACGPQKPHPCSKTPESLRLWVVLSKRWANGTTQQLRDATPFGDQPKYLITDNDSICGPDVIDFTTASGIQEVRTAYRSPWQSPIVDRAIVVLRRDLLDHIMPFDERHLRKSLKEFIRDYYHPIRTHSSLDHRPPFLREAVAKPLPLFGAQFQPQPILGGPLHSYDAKAARQLPILVRPGLLRQLSGCIVRLLTSKTQSHDTRRRLLSPSSLTCRRRAGAKRSLRLPVVPPDYIIAVDTGLRAKRR